MTFPSFLRPQCQKERRGVSCIFTIRGRIVRLCRTIRPYGQNDHFLSPKPQKRRQRSIESAKNAEFSTFSTIKVRNTSLLFAKVVILYKVRNFAERFACALQYSHDFRLKLKF